MEEEARQEWLESRRKGIGGSDSAAVLGLSKWKTPYQVWLEKTGQSGEQQDNEAMLWGRLLEPIIRQEYSNRTGLPVETPQMLSMPDRPFILANLDGLCPDRILEIKTARTALDWGEEGTDEIPESYLLQVQHYMMVTGFKLADVAVLIGSADFRIYHVKANVELHAVMLEAYASFWNTVETMTPPPPCSYADAARKYAVSVAREITADADISGCISRLKEIKEVKNSLETEENELKGRICSFMAENDTLTDSSGRKIATWKTGKPKNTFDLKAFKAANPGLYTQFCIETPGSRPFLIK